MSTSRQYEALEASELFCPTCRRAQPVRRHLLLVLPSGNKYQYRCAVCGTPVGAKDDSDASEYNAILSGRRLRRPG
jgi:DNA-directed RNA polymerase subunit RPC12/RpoP